MKSNLEQGKFYISKNLKIYKCIDNDNVAKTIDYEKHKVKKFANVESLNKLIQLELKFHYDDYEGQYNNYRNNQSITNLFDLIIHEKSNFSLSNADYIMRHNFIHIKTNYLENKYIATAIDNSKEFIILLNNRETRIKKLFEKLRDLHKILKNT